ncbi:hypothetical protein [Vibrio sp. D431a]|uniref:hypothetical protein n=1 Tax=Vibrio sp. D431a TaxID=2837388 RepID=UPI00255292E9|nr:hypothetical protein [Vibrio sp. D431a]MDK9789795.1 hypothetical protein [Vibrio sp. D431a]
MLREDIEEFAYENDLKLKFADGFDEAILGISQYLGNDQVVYDSNKCIDILTEQMDSDEALEYFHTNLIGAYIGENTPIFVETKLYCF